ncbi:TPA: DNA-binding protein, partial [Enterobacter hormaechei subsp. oharae]|nr:DNA-binding protein [Enterobacter hormaechei subsp. oharae]
MLLSKSAYARHMGVSRQTVYGWIARGEIVISGDKVDVEASQAKQNSAGAG